MTLFSGAKARKKDLPLLLLLLFPLLPLLWKKRQRIGRGASV